MIDTDTQLNDYTEQVSRIMALLKIQTEVLKSIHDFMYDEQFVQLMPVILSPITDPLNHSVMDASIQYYDQDFKLTKSMILHKQIALARSEAQGIYIMSPNVRLETKDKYDSGRHLFEFSQVDIELRDASSQIFMDFMEDLIIAVLTRVSERCALELSQFSGQIKIPTKPFKKYTSYELYEKYGPDFEQIMSLRMENFFWITDYRREFYDKEDPLHQGHYINYDLFYPNGYNEALSGGERDYDYEILLRKMQERHMQLTDFKYYLEEAKNGHLVASAGGGLGVERLIRYITKQSRIEDVCIFPKIPGKMVRF